MLRKCNLDFENNLFDNKKNNNKKLSRREFKYIVNNRIFLKFFNYY